MISVLFISDSMIIKSGLGSILNSDGIKHNSVNIDEFLEHDNLAGDQNVLILAGFDFDETELMTLIEIKKIDKDIPVLAVYNKCQDAFELKALRAGAQGVIQNEKSFSLLPKAIKAVMQGKLWFSHKVLQRTLEIISGNTISSFNSGGSQNLLTKRELEVLSLLTTDMKSKDIADHLCISYSTVTGHINRIYRKLGVNSRMQALRYAYTHMHVDDPDQKFPDIH